jgi:L-asparaginase
LIYTGGAIGLMRRDDGKRRHPESREDLLRIAPELDEIVDFDFVPLLNKDSANINHHDWTTMAKSVHERIDGGYDGFVLAHGTDTMHFSAAAMSFALGRDLPWPVVFTGAQTVPEVHHGDARINLIRACNMALENVGEVVISFGDYVFRGCRAQKKDEARFDAFESPSHPPLGVVTERILIHPTARRRQPSARPELRARFAGGILQVPLIPGMRPELLYPAVESLDCRGVILQSFGAGSVPDEPPYSFMSFIARCVDLAKPVVITTAVTSRHAASPTLHSALAPGRAAISMGAIPTSNMTASCASVKFRWALAEAEGQRDPIEAVRTIMSSAYVDEMDPSE